MQKNAKMKYFEELILNLQRAGFTVGPEVDNLLPVELDGKRLCVATEGGSIRYRTEAVGGEARRAALDKVIDIVGVTAEYTKQMEAAPILKASGLSEEFKLLADFNGSVLAGQETKYGVQMVTWNWTYNKTGVTQGHYYGPGGADSYIAAKQDFAVRSGLVRDGALFAPEQLTEIYRSIHETLDSEYPITQERQKFLESAASQIERTVPNLEDRVEQSNQKELELESPGMDGMTFC